MPPTDQVQTGYAVDIRIKNGFWQTRIFVPGGSAAQAKASVRLQFHALHSQLELDKRIEFEITSVEKLQYIEAVA